MATREKHKNLLAKLKESEKIIVKHQALEASLRLSEQRFRATVSSTVDLIWEADSEKNTLQWFGDIDGLLGYSPGEFPHTVKAWSSSIHPDDRSRVSNKVKRILETGEEYYEDYHIKCKDGTYR
jgi:PAS domain S-box-containing protein